MIISCLEFLRARLVRKKIILAFSGGVDSAFLLFLCMTYFPNIDISLMYVYESAEYEKGQLDFVKSTSIKLRLTLYMEEVFCHGKRFFGCQEHRDAIYNSLLKYTDPNTVVLTGHHLSDQIENLFLKLARGSHPMAWGIQDDFIRGGVRHLRPMLSLTKVEIRRYAAKYNVPFYEYTKNDVVDLCKRNMLRKKLLNNANCLHDNFESNALITCNLLHEYNNVNSFFTNKALSVCVISNTQLKISSLLAETDNNMQVIKHIIVFWLHSHDVVLSRQQIASLTAKITECYYCLYITQYKRVVLEKDILTILKTS